MKHKYRNFFIVTVVIVLTITAIPNVLGKTRQLYLIDFIYDTEIEGFGFSNAIVNLEILDTDEKKEEEISNEATAYALKILNDLGRNPHDIETLENKIENRIDQMFDSTQVNLYELYYLMNSLNTLEYAIDSTLSNRIYKYLNDTSQITGGFSYSNTTHIATMSSTYYVTSLYSLIEKPIVNISTHKNWILSCNNTDGGFGANQTSSSTLIDTCFAVFILGDDRFGDINDFANIDNTLSYINSFYVNVSADLDNYGGYFPNELAGYALLSSTYYCTKAISLIDDTILNIQETRSWILKQQNFEDGGFAENSESPQSKSSSVIASYYAFKSLEVLNSLHYLLNEIWAVEFEYWILGVVLGSIGMAIAIIVFLWRRRRI